MPNLEADAAAKLAPRGDAAFELVRSITVHVSGMTGSGLALSFAAAEPFVVPADGTWEIPLSQPASDVTVMVTAQPTLPRQLCEASQLASDVFTVVCRDQTRKVSGVIAGLEGKGLEITLFDHETSGATEHVHAVHQAESDGAFSFERELEDGVHYAVRITAQPTGPRQTCVLAGGEGRADGTGDDIAVHCETNRYVFTSVVSGLQGTGLTIEAAAGVTYPITHTGVRTYTESPYPDGSHYNITIKTQPTNPDQVCYIQGGEGVIDGADVSYEIICNAANNLRISEVGACPYVNSSCWFEISNVGAQVEQLAFYQLRTSAISSTGYVPSRVFTLPTITVPPFSQIVIAGKTTSALADGQGVYHVGDGDTVPWWPSDGFVELLLGSSGATAAFVRFGANTTEPTTGGTWSGGAAPALPRLANAYGYSLQHSRVLGQQPTSGEDWSLRSFATYAGPNDVVSEVDDDRDGIPDSAEVLGGRFGGIDVYGMGARPDQRDVFVEIDYMAGGDPATTPRREALDKLVDSFARHKIAMHFDVGSLYSPSFSPFDYNLGGGNEVPFVQSMQIAPTAAGIADLYDYKAAHMEGRRRMVFYYLMFAWSQEKDGSGGSSGVGELPGNDSLITLGGFGLTANSQAQRNLVANYQAATVMHELGHNFGLRHGGSDSRNRKPNYVSVMNYLYSPLGLPTIGKLEGDRYDFYRRCRLFSITQLTNAPTSSTLSFLLDYSSGTSTSINEFALDEGKGLGRVGSGPVDFNCNGGVDAPYARDVNNDGAFELLTDNDDWASLDFVFRRKLAGAESGPSLLVRPALQREDALTADREHHTDEPCPAIVLPAP